MTINTSKKTFKDRLGKTLIIWFMALSIIPMTIVAVFSYSKALNSLEKEVVKALTATATSKTDFIDNWYAYRLIDLSTQSAQNNSIRFLQELKDSY